MREDKSRLLLPLLKRTLWDLENTLSLRTLENYRSAISKVREFAGDNWQRLTVTAITRQWTDNFTRWLQQQHADKPQTVDFYLCTFRAVYRHALNLTESAANAQPFGGPRPGGSFSAKRALKRDDMLKILSPELREKLKPRQIEALDVLVFIFYSRGMAFQDVYRLRWSMISDGHIRYKRSKTGALIDVEVVPELEEIMRRYHRKDSPYVLPFLHESRKGNTGKELSEKSALRRINRAVYNIIGDVKLTTYVLRNHRFIVKITSVGSVGEPTPDEAYKSVKSSISAGVIDWVDENRDIVFDGESWVSIETKHVDFTDGKDIHKLIGIKSNVLPSQWKMKFSDNADYSTDAEVSNEFFHVTKPADSNVQAATEHGGNIVIKTLKELTQYSVMNPDPDNPGNLIPDTTSKKNEPRHGTLKIIIKRLEITVTLTQYPYTPNGWTEGGTFNGSF